MKKRRPILFLLLLLAGVALASWLFTRRHDGAHSVSGAIEVDEVHVASRYGGRVERIHTQEGDVLRAGQVIAELDASEQRARRDQAAAALEELERGPRPSEIEAARHEWESLAAQRDFTGAELKRARELFRQKVFSQTELDSAISRADSLSQSATAAKKRFDLLAEGTRPERVAQARAQLAEIDAQLREMKIVAPGDSVLEVLNVKVGDVLGPNRELATLLLPEHLWVRVYVPEPWLGLITTGQQVKIRTDAHGRREFTGSIEQINRQAEFTPRNVQTVEDRVRQVFGVKVRLPNDTGALRAGMSVDVFFNNMPKEVL